MTLKSSAKMRTRLFLLCWLTLGGVSNTGAEGTGSPCYLMDENQSEDLSKPQKCMPAFENVVAGKYVSVTPEAMTCGTKSVTEYCVQTHGIYRECDLCQDNVPEKRHPGDFLTDIHKDFNPTWWQSVTMLEQVHEKDVNLTVSLGKAYDITYVRLKFQSPRPASFTIYKKNRANPALPDSDPDGGWIPWQYYSATCRDTYSQPDSTSIIQPRDGGQTKVSEDRALCTSEYSDMTPLTGANVAFSTLEGRPSAFNFEYSPELQDWVSATDIRITLQRLNTFGDEVFGDFKVLRSYYYAITDFTVGGRCQCNGHATHCMPAAEDGYNGVSEYNTTMICLCQHGTAGANCETCLDDHWDVPWKRATSQRANECRPCECNDWSSRCRFNEQLYTDTGRGGQCLDCQGNRDGPNCERCKDNHFFSPQTDALGRTPCEACNCDPTGSTNLQCSPEGQCECKPGVTGPKCDRCDVNYYNFGPLGCQSCGCEAEGSIQNVAACDATDGNCYCKQNVEGQRCDRCKAGHFFIDEYNEFGCTPCFCYGHTSSCDLSGGYSKSIIRSDFSRSSEDWTSVEDGRELPLKYDGINKYIGVQSNPVNPSSDGNAYFHAPPNYLGDQRASYNQRLSFKLRINDVGPRPGAEDIVIEGGGAKTLRITLSITDQNNPMPSYELQDYTFRLHENPEFGWSPRLSSKDFMAVLANITALRIRGSYVRQGMGFIDEMSMDTAERGGSGAQATWIERCECPPGYQGQFCQLCQEGYHHENNGGPFARCIPCSCNGHADTCDAESGECACRDNTSGHNCELCAKGFYGNALQGAPDDCQECPCPEGGACLELPGDKDSPICIECPEGRTGARCELCMDGYFGDPLGSEGPARECRPCDCNGNIDLNAIGNCNKTTGECLRCVDNTAGFQCERCQSGFFGDALALKKPGDPPSCQPCQCYPIGTNLNVETYLPVCNGYNGDCSCKEHVVGRDCDKCADGYFNLDSGEGCEACNCDSIGSFNATCHVQTGQCYCRPGVTGLRCDMCMPYHFGFSPDGCTACECDRSGSKDMQCDLITGQCDCRDKVEGRRCDRCMENSRSRDYGGRSGEKICEPCDDCYNLVQDATDAHRDNLASLDRLLQQIAENPEPVGEDFEYQLRQLQVRVKATLADARISSQNDEDGGTLRDRLEELRVKLEEVVGLVVSADGQIRVAKEQGQEADRDVTKAKDVMDRAREALKNAQRQLDTQGREALRRAQERSKKFGEESEKMSAIAREARMLAEQQVEDASEISSIAKQAYDTSSDAYQLARDALEQQHYTANQITVLEVQVGELGEKLRTVQSLAGQTLRDSTEAYNEALRIYQQAYSLDVPEVDHVTLEDQAAKVEREAKRIQEEAQRLIADNADLLATAQDRRMQLSDLLQRAEQQQKQLDTQLSDMEMSKDRALEAVNMGNNVLSDASNTLRTLQEFETRVTENQESAQQALEQISSIEDMIRSAEEKTLQSVEAMNGADTSAQLALNVALDAEKISGEASGRAANISAEAGQTLEEAVELAESAQSLADKLDETRQMVEEKERVASEDGEAALTALSKANQAQNKAREANMKVEQAKKELENIAAILSTVQEPEPGLLDDLARRVEEAERQFQVEDLELKLKDLEAAKQRQVEQVREMERELNYLREESENINSIRDSLPNFCPKSNELCLEDQC